MEGNMKHGLVMEGGAMRGLFTAGVIDILMENGIEFDCAVGVSAGAAFGCNYKSGQPRRAIRYNLRFAKDKRYCSWRSMIKTGDLYGAEFCYHEVPEKLDLFDFRAYEQSPMEFYVVCTDVETGQPVYRKCRNMDRENMEWLRASASMPIVSRVVELDGRKLLDGGISDSIPLRFMESTGCERNVVVLTRPRDYRKKNGKHGGFVKLMLKKYPKLVKAMENRPRMYNGELKYISEAEKAGRALVIAPDEPLPAGHIEHDTDVLLETYRRGRLKGMEMLDAVRDFLGTEEKE